VRSYKKARGFSLLEIMIAVLVFSIGLLGTAALTASSVKSNNVAYLRSQANFLTANMADRMAANHLPVWANAFDGTFNEATTITRDCDATSPCTEDERALRDAQQWGQMVGTLLPNGVGTIACTPGARPAGGGRPAPNGPCVITVQWSEQTELEADGTLTQSFILNFQP